MSLIHFKLLLITFISLIAFSFNVFTNIPLINIFVLIIFILTIHMLVDIAAIKVILNELTNRVVGEKNDRKIE